MRRALSIAALVVSLVGPRASEAQVLNGSLNGTVRDEDGLVVSGVQVAVKSPSLIGGSRTATTDPKGQFRFPGLPPGLYEITLTKPLFQTSTSSGISVTTVAPMNLEFKLTVRRVEDTVQVTAKMDTGNPGLGTHFGSTKLQDLPTPRNGMFAFVPLGPFISQTSRTTSLLSAAGGGVDQNSYYADGTNISAASNSVARTEPGIDFAQDIRVQLMASAEYGNMQGAVIEMIMRQGSDRFLWDGSLYGQPGWLTSQPIVRPINFTGTEMSGYERRHFANATTTLGGPIVRNRGLFFAGYEYLRDEDSQPGGDPDFPKRYRQHKMFGKVTWLIAPGWQLMQSVHYESWDNRELPTANKRVEATQRVQATVPAVTFGNLTHVSRANRVWEVSAGRYEWSQDITRSTGDPTVPGRLDRQTNVASGAPSQIGELNQIRWTARASVSQYQAGFLGTDHQWKVGGQFDRGQHRSLLVVPTGVRYEDNAPAPTRAFVSGPSNAAGRFNTASAFITDEFHAGSRVSVAAGIRFDYSRAISPDIARLNADGTDTGTVIAGLGFLYSWQVFSPRISLAAQLTADGRTIARLSYGKFRQGIMTGELSPDHPGAAPVTQGNYNPATGTISNPTTINPTDNVEIDSATRTPTTDMYSVVIDREISRPVTLSVAYVHKDGREFIGWNDIGGTYRQDWMTTAHGVTIPVHVLTSAPAGRRFSLRNQPEYSLTYDGFTVMVEKRLSHGWYANGSYTLSRASGLQPSGGTTAAGAQVATTGAPPVSFAPPVTFGRDPNSLTNAGGRLPNDRPHLFRLMGALDLPKTGINLSASAQHSTGKPWANTADIIPSQAQGAMRVLLEERGTQRLSSQTLLDLRVSRAFSLGANARVDVRFDILNLFNDTAEESITSDRYGTPTYNIPNVFLDPRRVMLSVKVNVGK
jgi:hypothetical protein